MDYGRAIRIARSTQGWSQTRLAKEIQLTPSHISLLEAGLRAPSTETLERIAARLGVPMHLLLLLAADQQNLRGIGEVEAQQLGQWMLGLVTGAPNSQGSRTPRVRPSAQIPLSWGYLERVLRTSRSALRALAAGATREYHPFLLERPGRKARPIDNPSRRLKGVQSRMLSQILSRAPIPDTMIGGITGKTILDNASPHCGQACVVTLDLKSCFRRIPSREVFGVFRTVFGATESFANLLTQLTTLRGALPQGAPTSTLLAVLCLSPMHQEVRELAVHRSLRFTQWLDDLTLSGDGAEGAIGDVIRVVCAHGHSVSTRKVRVMRRGEPQVVTGIVVNADPRPPREFVEETSRQMLQLLKGTSIGVRDWQSVMGKLSHVQFVSPRQGLRLLVRAARWGFPTRAPDAEAQK